VRRLAFITAAAALGVAAAGCGSDTTASSTASTATGAGGSAVAVENFAFSPLTLTVKVGTTVTWTNKDTSVHAPIADDNSFDAGNIAGGASGSATLTKVGTIKYHCSIHQYMTGTVVVTN
jgi:plastocyanin